MKPGEYFRKKRMEKGITLAQAAKDLYLQEKYLQALEDDNYDIIPGETYQRAYFKKYASYLGLSELFERAVQSEEVSMNGKTRESETILGGTWDSPRYARVIGKIAGIAIIIILIVMGVRAKNAAPPPVHEPDRVTGTQTRDVTPVTSNPSWEVPTANSSLNALAHEVLLKSSAQNWITVKTRSGTLLYDFMYDGDELSFTDQIGFYISVGNPEDIEITFDGEPVNFEPGSREIYLPETFTLEATEEVSSTTSDENTGGSPSGTTPSDGSDDGSATN